MKRKEKQNSLKSQSTYQNQIQSTNFEILKNYKGDRLMEKVYNMKDQMGNVGRGTETPRKNQQ